MFLDQPRNSKHDLISILSNIKFHQKVSKSHVQQIKTAFNVQIILSLWERESSITIMLIQDFDLYGSARKFFASFVNVALSGWESPFLPFNTVIPSPDNVLTRAKVLAFVAPTILSLKKTFDGFFKSLLEKYLPCHLIYILPYFFPYLFRRHYYLFHRVSPSNPRSSARSSAHFLYFLLVYVYLQ